MSTTATAPGKSFPRPLGTKSGIQRSPASLIFCCLLALGATSVLAADVKILPPGAITFKADDNLPGVGTIVQESRVGPTGITLTGKRK